MEFTTHQKSHPYVRTPNKILQPISQTWQHKYHANILQTNLGLLAHFLPITNSIVHLDLSLKLLRLSSKVRTSLGIPKNNDHRISSEKHLTDESILVNWKSLFLAFPSLRHLDKRNPMLFNWR